MLHPFLPGRLLWRALLDVAEAEVGVVDGGRGRGKRSQDSPDEHETASYLEAKRRKTENNGPPTASSKQKASNVPAKKYLGVQVHRVYAHAQIHVNGKVINLGTFATAKDAAMAYDKAALKHFGGPIGSSDARPDEIVLNFPERRDEFLAQLIEEEKQKMARQAGGSNYASRSAQNAKYNLSIMKLNSWMSKLQRSVKMVEAAQRVEWGLHSAPSKDSEGQEEKEEREEGDATIISSLVKTEIFGSGPTIKKEFTTRDQKLRQSKKEIQDAISLMIEELKIYAADAPVDPLFEPPPHCSHILDLLSTSRHLKLISAINDLAHLKVKADGRDPNSVADGHFESKLQAVVDYRARLQMSSSNEKQKLAHFMRDLALYPGPNATTTATTAETGSHDQKKPELLKNAKYVKRKVPVSKSVDSNTQNKDLPKHTSAETSQMDQETKEEPVDATRETETLPAAEVKMEVISAEDEKHPDKATIGAAAQEIMGSTVPAATEAKQTATTADSDNVLSTGGNNGDEQLSAVGNDIEQVIPLETPNEKVTTEVSEALRGLSQNTEEKVDVDQSESCHPEASKPNESKSVTSEDDKNEEAISDERKAKPTSEESAETKEPEEPEKMLVDQDKIDADKSQQNHPASARTDNDVIMDDAVNGEVSVAVVAPKEDFEWQFCLAVQVHSTKDSPTAAEDVWRLLPISSDNHTGEFVDGTFLTEKEVSEMEVSEEEVCSSSAADDGKTAWMEHLRQLHVEESQVRQEILRETNHQHALQGIMKIEQDRLNDASVVYREAMNKLDTKTALALKNHARVSQDAQLVKLMQHSFNPILGDLLDKCEEALLNCFRKLSVRFEDFAQEFEYYRNALLSLTQSSKAEISFDEGPESPVDAADMVVDNDSVTIKRENIEKVTGQPADINSSMHGEIVELAEDNEVISTEDDDELDDFDDSSGLRQAYITFYMDEMEALWKERSSSLEMVQAIQRALLNNAIEVSAHIEKPVELKIPSETETSEDAEMTTEEAAESKAQEPIVTNTQPEQKTMESDTIPGESHEKAADGTIVESSQQLDISVEKAVDTPEMADTAAGMPIAGPPKSDAVQVNSEVVFKTEPQDITGKFRREQELREAVESCLSQWQRIQWPDELNSTFLTPTSLELPSVLSAVKIERVNAQSLVATDEDESEFDSPYSVMDELKRVMIDLTQDQVIPVPPPVQPTTLVMYHPVFINHQTPKNHPECPERMDRVVNILNTLVKKHQETLKLDRLAMSPEELCPPETTLLMVHSPTYLRQLKERSIEAGSQSASSPTASSPSSRALVFESDSGIREETPKRGGRKKNGRPPLVGAFGAASLEQNGVELDTFVSSKSWDVARAAAGTVCLAVDRVVRKEYHNAVCLVRPPGHHVGRHGRTENAPSSGFCLLNNVVIGATHARLYPWIRKVAVLDWDIHHGNGTEELLKDDPDAFFASIHLYSSGRYFPGTGKSCETGNLINVALENTGAGSGSQAFRSALESKVLPAMRAFQPDIIFISAGFDGHRDDILGGVAAVNNPNVPAGYVEEDYAWATLEVLKLAAEVCDGRVVSVLEGGYDVRRETNSLAKSVAAHVAAISAYEAARRKAVNSATVDVEMKEEEGAGDETTGTAGTSTLVKTEHPIKKEAVGLLEKLLATNLDDGNVIIIDDEDKEEDDGAHEVQDVDDAEDEDTGEEEDDGDDVPMENAEGEPESEDPHAHEDKREHDSHSSMEVDES